MSVDTMNRRKDNLPLETTSFVGRRKELAALKKLLSTARMVTVTGPGGVGKTRVAVRLAAELRRAFPDGVWMVELAMLNPSGLVVHAVASALDVHDMPSDDPAKFLGEQLEDRQLLLVLDNCEHLLDECAGVAGTLLRKCPRMRVLATSRQALGVEGEFVFNLIPLAVPTSGDAMPSAPAVSGYDAVTLFTDRAGALLPGYTVTADNRDVVISLCQRLEGIPLAIELASARLRALSETQILERLDDRYGLLTTGPRSAQPRQQTLQAVVEWSFDLCSTQEQTVWQRCSVFAGGFDLEAAEFVCADETIVSGQVLDVVAGLVDKSILTREDRGVAVRYLMLETLRDYGLTRLAASGEEQPTRRRHRDYFDRLAHGRLFGAGVAELLDRLRAEHANLRTALEFCASDPVEAVRGQAMAASLWQFWEAAGAVAEGRTWLLRLLDLAPKQGNATHVRALCIAGWLALLQNDVLGATAMLEATEPEVARADERSVVGYVALLGGSVALSGGRNLDATASYERAIDGFRSEGDTLWVVMTLRRLAMAASAMGDHDRAVAHYRECLRVCEEEGELWQKGYVLWGLGLEAWRTADRPRAKDLLRESIRIDLAFGDRRGVALAIEALAWVAVGENEAERAAHLLGAADTIWRIFDAPLSGFPQLAEDHGACEASARRALGDRGFDTAYEYGAGLASHDAAEYALDSPDSRAPSRVTSTTPGRLSPLTRRESEIAELIAQGLTDREISAQLVISKRTAEGHVEHILTKLGFRSRTQIATWLLGTRGPHSDDQGAQ